MSSFECAALKTNTRALAYRKPILLSSRGSLISLWHEADKVKCVKTLLLDLNEPIIGIKFEDTCLIRDPSLAPLDQHSAEQNVLFYSTRFIVYCCLTVKYEAGNLVHCELKQNFKVNLIYWIIDCVFGFDLAYILNSRNEVLSYSLTQRKILTRIFGPQKCIIYSGKLLQYSHHGLVVASGTVFKTILLWAVEVDASKCGRLVNIQALHGHDGVIFSVDYNWQHNIIISASDDRSIRIWTGNRTGYKAPKSLDMQFWKENNSFQLAHIYYGHSARIWNVASLSLNNNPPIVISTGEDSSVFTWSLLPPYSSIQKKWLLRNNRIWSFEILQQHIALGGSDSSVKFIDFDDLLGTGAFIPSRIDFSISSPKAICYLRSDSESTNLLCASTQGIFYIVCERSTLQKIQLEMSFVNDRSEDVFSDYICLQSNPTRSKAVIASKYGHLCLVTATNDHFRCVHTIKPFESKIFDVSFVNEHQFICCLATGQMRLFSVEGDTLLPNDFTFVLPTTRQPWSSCGVLVGDLLIVGDYTGSVFAYRTTSPDAPVSQFRHVHGRNGVNCLQQRPHSPFVYSSGRNGKILEYLIETKEDGVHLELLRTFAVLQMEWIGGFQFDSCFPFAMNYAYGFESRNFLLWNMSENKITFEEECGGGHRSWDLIIDSTEAKQANLHFSYIKQNNLTSVHFKLPLLQDPSTETYSSLPRHINCCAQLYNSAESLYFLLGGEDNVIQVVRFHRATRALLSCLTLHSHISNVSSIKCLPPKRMKNRLLIYAISAGGRSQFVLWKFTVNANDELICQERISNFLGKFNHHLMFEEGARKANKVAHQAQPDLNIRYLNVDFCPYSQSHSTSEYLIHVACSDSTSRVFRYNDEERRIVQLAKLSSGTGCVLLSNLVNIDSTTLCALASSDGCLSMWALGETTESVLSCKLHQAGINAIDFRYVNETLLALTGGDDNALKLTAISINHDSAWSYRTMDLSSMHTCQITGLRFLSNCEFVSAAIDQNVVRWRIRIDSGLDEVAQEVIDSYVSPIADISSLELISYKSDLFVLICGEGFELLKISNAMLTGPNADLFSCKIP